MIGQYLSNTNKSATIPILQFFLELNKAQNSGGQWKRWNHYRRCKNEPRRFGGPNILAPPKEVDVKQIDLGTSDPSKTTTISAYLYEK